MVQECQLLQNTTAVHHKSTVRIDDFVLQGATTVHILVRVYCHLSSGVHNCTDSTIQRVVCLYQQPPDDGLLTGNFVTHVASSLTIPVLFLLSIRALDCRFLGEHEVAIVFPERATMLTDVYHQVKPSLSWPSLTWVLVVSCALAEQCKAGCYDQGPLSPTGTSDGLLSDSCWSVYCLSLHKRSRM